MKKESYLIFFKSVIIFDLIIWKIGNNDWSNCQGALGVRFVITIIIYHPCPVQQ